MIALLVSIVVVLITFHVLTAKKLTELQDRIEYLEEEL